MFKSQQFFLILHLLKKVRHIINYLIWATVGLYLLLTVMVNIPMTQHVIGSAVASALSSKFGTTVTVGKVNLGFFNRIIIDDVSMLDQQQHHLLRATRLSAKFSYLDLLKGRVTIVSAQMFGLEANLYKATAKSKPNFQFVIDSLASKDTTHHEPLHLDINSLVIRHGKIAWNQLDAPHKQGFDTHHMHFSNISSHIILRLVGSDSVNVNLRKLAFDEASGIHLASLSLRAAAGHNGLQLHDFQLTLPHSEINIPALTATYRKRQWSTAHYQGLLAESHVFLPDLSAFVMPFKSMPRQVVVKSSIQGHGHEITITSLAASLLKPQARPIATAPSDIRLMASAWVNLAGSHPQWRVRLPLLTVNGEGMKLLAGHVPDAVSRLRTLKFRGKASGYYHDVMVDGQLVSDLGNAKLTFNKTGDNMRAHLDTGGFNIGQVLGNDQLGLLATNINGEGNIKPSHYTAKGQISRLDYKGYSYHDITIDGQADKRRFSGSISINDPNVRMIAKGTVDLQSAAHVYQLTGDIEHLVPEKLRLFTGRLAEASYKARLKAAITGNDIYHAKGYVVVNNFTMDRGQDSYALDSLRLQTGTTSHGHYIRMNSDFAQALLYGTSDYKSMIQSVENVIVKKLPSISHLAPFHYRHVASGNFSLAADVYKGDWAKAFFNIPVELSDTLHVEAAVTDNGNALNGRLTAPDLAYSGNQLRNISAKVETIDGILHAKASLRKMRTGDKGTDVALDMKAGGDQLQAAMSFDNHATAQRFRGQINSHVSFDETADGHSQAILKLQQSSYSIGDTIFNLRPSTLIYSKKRLEIDNFLVASSGQSIRLNGVVSDHSTDSITAELHNVNVAYVLDLVNFHSVDFSGAVSGIANVKELFGRPYMSGQLRVDDFTLMDGHLGTLFAKADWNPDKGQIDIDAVAKDTIGNNPLTVKPRLTVVKGYVSPKRNELDLDIQLHKTRGEFIGKICSSFLDNFDLSADGNIKIAGPFKRLNLTGQVKANGSTHIRPLGTTYSLKDADVSLIENEIVFDHDTITDKNGNHGIITGGIHHNHLSRWSYDLDITARHMLAFDTNGNDGSSFYGHVFGNGKASIAGGGGSGNVNININVTPDKNSEIVYDISSPETVGGHDFIHWTSRDTLTTANDSLKRQAAQTDDDIPTNIHLNFLINTTPDATLRIIMDRQSGDYIALNGSGTLRANWFNKGSMDIFGTYTINSGTYKLTIQNIIKKVFNFADGGTIVFGGNPMNAQLHLSAVYPIASVSLSDLQIGRSFSSNNTRVNCLMNITGTPSAPKVDFNLDFPSLDADAKQMIYSLISSEEQMNQQVLYLLAVGRFYTESSNNAQAQSTNQTSLAMQSILSGQISQQINNVLSGLIKNNQWNFGANISTGDEGWNNAEYEGLLSGRLLNNRLLINGQFGYRDNANATQSFIGDFDVRYLIFPNGNFSVHVYNKTNDRYFTRNSLNTQGIGFIIKKDFTSLRDLFSFSSKKKQNK